MTDLNFTRQEMIDFLIQLTVKYLPILLIVLLIVVCIFIAVLIDFRSGIRKARERGEPILSDGFRRSVRKLTQYYSLIVFMIMIDTILLVVIEAFKTSNTSLMGDIMRFIASVPSLPYFTIVVGIALIWIEYKSVKEASDKKVQRQMDKLEALLKEKGINIYDKIKKDDETNS